MDDLIDKLIKTKHVNGALYNLRQLHFAIFDMAIYTPASHEEVEAMEISKLYNELRTQISGLNSLEEFGMPR